MLSNIHQSPSPRVDTTYRTHMHSVLDEGITKKIQVRNDMGLNGCAAPPLHERRECCCSAARPETAHNCVVTVGVLTVLFETRATNSPNLDATGVCHEGEVCPSIAGDSA
jgi:hypothetical protein